MVNPVYQEIPEGRRSKSASSYLQQQQQRQSSVEQNGRSYRLSIPPPIPSQHLSVDDIRDLDLTPDTVAIVRASQEELHSTSAGKNAAAAVVRMTVCLYAERNYNTQYNICNSASA